MTVQPLSPVEVWTLKAQRLSVAADMSFGSMRSIGNARMNPFSAMFIPIDVMHK